MPEEELAFNADASEVAGDVGHGLFNRRVMVARMSSGTLPATRKARSRRKVDSGRQDDLLSKLTEVVLADGFVDMTIDDMAMRLQCSKTTLYGIASSKQTLVAAALKRFFKQATDRIESEIAAVEDPAERVATYLAGVGGQMRRLSPVCYADMVALETTRDVYTLNSRAAAQRVRLLIDEGVRSGAFRPVNARFVGEAVNVLIASIQQGDLLDRAGMSSGDAFIALGDLVLSALKG